MALLKVALVAIPLVLFYLYRKVKWYRFEQNKEFPAPKSDWLWGHMKLMNEVVNEPGDTPGMNTDYGFRKLFERNGNPDLLLIDVRPLSYCICVVGDPFVAEQISKPSKVFKYSLPKSPTLAEFFPAVGQHSMLAQGGQEWKTLRKQFNPGFAPRHLITMLPAILDKTRTFLAKIDERCASGEVFSLDDLFIRLTFDIIGAVTMNLDFNAQGPVEGVHPIASKMMKTLQTFNVKSDLAYFNPFVRNARNKAGLATDKVLKREISNQFHELRSTDPHMESQRAKSVLALALQDRKYLTEDALQDANDQIKTFLLAGHDTTAILLSWALYSLSLNPATLKTACDELDNVLGQSKDPESIFQTLLDGGEDILGKLPYISAIIKETLRLYPPAGTARYSPPGSGMMVTLSNGKTLCIDGVVMYNCQYLIQRNKKVYGETADDFVPERWLGNTDTSMATNEDENGPEEKETQGIPPSAWRPFERGPRNCIGQELANIEARVILAMVLRRYRFEKVGMGEPKLDEKGQKILNKKGVYLVQSELLNRRQVTLKPIDGMMMRVKHA